MALLPSLVRRSRPRTRRTPRRRRTGREGPAGHGRAHRASPGDGPEETAVRSHLRGPPAERDLRPPSRVVTGGLWLVIRLRDGRRRAPNRRRIPRPRGLSVGGDTATSHAADSRARQRRWLLRTSRSGSARCSGRPDSIRLGAPDDRLGAPDVRLGAPDVRGLDAPDVRRYAAHPACSGPLLPGLPAHCRTNRAAARRLHTSGRLPQGERGRQRSSSRQDWPIPLDPRPRWTLDPWTLDPAGPSTPLDPRPRWTLDPAGPSKAHKPTGATTEGPRRRRGPSLAEPRCVEIWGQQSPSRLRPRPLPPGGCGSC